jgi:hypothetical protein
VWDVLIYLVARTTLFFGDVGTMRNGDAGVGPSEGGDRLAPVRDTDIFSSV